MSEKQDPYWMHKEYPKTCAPDDFWGQVKRTVKGKAVPEAQIDLIVTAIRQGLNFQQSDILLDLGCGNGALSNYFFPYCGGMLGVDFSQYLISVAKANFEQAPAFTFLESDILDYVRNEKEPHRFSKILCYGAFQYLVPDVAKEVLALLNKRFVNVTLFFIGNLPDKDRITSFYPPETDYASLVNDHTSPLGVWRTKSDFQDLAAHAGWEVDYRTMPESFYASHYRYDAVLRRV